MKLINWETPLSHCKSLNFEKLTDDGNVRFLVETDTKEKFEVTFGGFCGPYIMSDEEFLVHYWHSKDKNIGWTFEVLNSDIMEFYSRPTAPENYRHFVVSTQDTCLEVLCLNEPLIKQIQK